jgi:serine protease Do
LEVASAASTGPTDPALSDLVASLLPSVVNIYTTTYKEIQVLEGKSVMVQDAEPDKRHFFGSGFIVAPEGYVVTNKHVTHNAINIYVTMNDGRRLPADLVSEAVSFDIAVIKIRTDQPLPPVKMGDSRTVHQGDFVIAIDNSLGFTSTVTTGIISAVDRDMGFTEFDHYMQTDAAINHGNSGGPLFNAAGEVVGVNSAIYATGSDTGNVGIGLVIPINDAKMVMNHMKEVRSGKGVLAYMGAQVLSLTPDLAAAYGLPGPWGSIVVKVPDGTAAARAKLRAGDIISSRLVAIAASVTAA